MAVAVTGKLVPCAPSWWDEEVGRLLATAPTLPRSARIAVRRVLRSLLHDPATDALAARDIRALLNVLDPVGGSSSLLEDHRHRTVVH
jgi:hypothetical protein